MEWYQQFHFCVQTEIQKILKVLLQSKLTADQVLNKVIFGSLSLEVLNDFNILVGRVKLHPKTTMFLFSFPWCHPLPVWSRLFQCDNYKTVLLDYSVNNLRVQTIFDTCPIYMYISFLWEKEGFPSIDHNEYDKFISIVWFYG